MRVWVRALRSNSVGKAIVLQRARRPFLDELGPGMTFTDDLP